MVKFLVDIRVIRAIQHKLFILTYETILVCTIVHFVYILVLVNILYTLFFGGFMLLLNQIVLHEVPESANMVIFVR